MAQHLQQPRIKLFDKLYGCFKIQIPPKEGGDGGEERLFGRK
jgi:hypothetical protein